MSPKKQARKGANNAAANKKRSRGFTDEERAAMKERARELTAEARPGADKADGESAVLAKKGTAQDGSRRDRCEVSVASRRDTAPS